MQRKSIKSYKDFIVWQRAMDLVIAIYALTKSFPQHELYGITSQMRRAAISIPSNIAESRKRGSRKDYRHFLVMAYSTGAELETQILISKRLSYGLASVYRRTDSLLPEAMKMLNKMLSTLK
jgi:four helix bundle protein